MSSVRTGGVFEFHNAGPLTTAWTAPASCTTLNNHLTGIEFPDKRGRPLLGLVSCGQQRSRPADCRPNGEFLEDMYQELYGVNGDNPRPLETTIRTEIHRHYYSPGLLCPNGGTTVGVISFKDGSLDPSGIFESTTFDGASTEKRAWPRSNFAVNALTSVLGPSETAIVCCPSGFTGHVLHGCYSTIDLAKVTSSTGCISYWDNNGDISATWTTFEYFGTRIDQEIVGFVSPTSGSVSMWRHEETVTLDGSGRPDLTDRLYSPLETGNVVAMEWGNHVYLISGGGEGSNASDDSNDDDDVEDGKAQGGGGKDEGGKDEEETETEETKANGNSESAAGPLGPASSWSVVGAIAAVWVLGLAGVCVL